MSESAASADAPSHSTAARASAGQILRDARQAQGMHIAALAAVIKVSHKKLELLETDRFDELPDATFTRALAQTVCRALKIDAAPVLALLPTPTGHRLEQVGEGINAPFRQRPGRREASQWSFVLSPAVWGPLLLLGAAAVLYWLPPGWLARWQLSPSAASIGAPATPASATSASAHEATPPQRALPPVERAREAPTAAPLAPAAASGVAASAPGAAAASQPAAPSSAAHAEANTDVRATEPRPASADLALVQLHTHATSWVKVRDARAKLLMSRMMQPGEGFMLTADPAVRLKVGNAAATEVVFRGQAVDLAARTRNNMAQLELK